MLATFNLKKIITVFVAIVFVVSGVFILQYIRNIAYIEINNTTGGVLDVTIVEANNNKIEQQFKTTKKSFRIKRGAFSVFVKSSKDNYFVTGKAGGFLSKSSVDPRFQKESKKTFVAENPSSCYYKNEKFISYICGGNFENARIHIPATESSPQYVIKSKPADIGANIITNTYTQKGEVLFVNYQSIPVDSEFIEDFEPSKNSVYNGYMLYFVDNENTISKKFELPELNKNTLFKMRSSRDVLLFYSDKDVYSYNINDQKIQKIDLPSQKTPLQNIDIQGNFIVASYNNPATDPKGKSEKSLLVTIKEGKIVAKKTTPQTVENVAFCSDKLLCVKLGSRLSVLDVNNKLREVQSIPGVKQLYQLNTSTLLLTDYAVINYNISTKDGHAELTTGSYSVTNIVGTKGGYIVTLTKSGAKTVAIEVDQNVEDNENILEKIAALSQTPQILSLSVSGNIIYYIPNVPLEDNPSTGEKEYNRVILQAANQEIAKKAQEIGLSSTYKLISTIR